MTLRIDSLEAERLAQALSDATGESLDEAVIIALRERLRRQELRQRDSEAVKLQIIAIGVECSTLPILDGRTADEILGYDHVGLPG